MDFLRELPRQHAAHLPVHVSPGAGHGHRHWTGAAAQHMARSRAQRGHHVRRLLLDAPGLSSAALGVAGRTLRSHSLRHIFVLDQQLLRRRGGGHRRSPARRLCAANAAQALHAASGALRPRAGHIGQQPPHGRIPLCSSHDARPALDGPLRGRRAQALDAPRRAARSVAALRRGGLDGLLQPPQHRACNFHALHGQPDAVSPEQAIHLPKALSSGALQPSGDARVLHLP